MQDDVYRLWKIKNRLQAEKERMKSRVNSQEGYYQSAIKSTRRFCRKKQLSKYKINYQLVQKRKKVLDSEVSRLRRIEAKYFRVEAELNNFIYDVSDIVGDYRDNFCVYFNRIRPQIDIFFGGLDGRPKGREHGHCGLDPVTLKPLFKTRYPGEPHPKRVKKQRKYEIFEEDTALTYSIAN